MRPKAVLTRAGGRHSEDYVYILPASVPLPRTAEELLETALLRMPATRFFAQDQLRERFDLIELDRRGER